MASKTLLEIIIHLDSFKNIEMYRRGLYYVRLSCKIGSQACPYLIYHQKSPLYPHPHHLQQASVADQSKSTQTRLFLLRYTDEEVLLKESCLFRIQVDSQIAQPLLIKAELCFADIGKNLQVRQVFERIRSGASDFNFSMVSQSTLKLDSPLNGIHQFMPITFNGIDASLLTCSLHCIVLNFQFANSVTYQTIESRLSSIILMSYNKLRNLIQQDETGLVSTNQSALMSDTEAPLLSQELCEISSQISLLCHKLTTILQQNPQSLLNSLKTAYSHRMQQICNNSVSTVWKLNKYSIMAENNLRRYRRKLASEWRRCNSLVVDMCIEDGLFNNKSPVLFEEIFTQDKTELFTENKAHSSNDGHLFVMVHGFLGNSFDMKMFRDNIQCVYPKTKFLMSKSNQGLTEGDIGEMGQRLAAQVIDLLENDESISKISFIGFSLGGVIIRAALPNLYNYNEMMHLLLSLNTPHLGCAAGESKVIDAGRWVLMKMKKSLSLKQLSMKEHKNIKRTFMYRLSQAAGVEWFKYFILVSCSQDKMVPFDSARIECGRSLWGANAVEMAECLLGRLEVTRLVRVDAHLTGKKLGKIIGRVAHLRVIECRAFQLLLLYRYSEAFSIDQICLIGAMLNFFQPRNRFIIIIR